MKNMFNKMSLGYGGLAVLATLLLLTIGMALAMDLNALALLPLMLLTGFFAIGFMQRITLGGIRGALGWTSAMEKSLKCTAAIATAYTIGKYGADDDHASLATAATDALVGIFQHTTSTADDMVKLMLSGISPVKYGGVVTRGDPLTSDGTGRAIKATVAGQSIIGIATISGVANDIGYCEISKSTMNAVQATLGNTFKGLAVAEFDPSTTAALRTIASHGLGVYLPDNAIITRAWYEVLTTFTSATDAATIAITIPTDDVAGIVAATAISAGGNVWDAGNHEAIQTGTAANYSEKCTAERELTATVAVEALTAGKFRLYCEYVVSI